MAETTKSDPRKHLRYRADNETLWDAICIATYYDRPDLANQINEFRKRVIPADCREPADEPPSTGSP